MGSYEFRRSAGIWLENNRSTLLIFAGIAAAGYFFQTQVANAAELALGMSPEAAHDASLKAELARLGLLGDNGLSLETGQTVAAGGFDRFYPDGSSERYSVALDDKGNVQVTPTGRPALGSGPWVGVDPKDSDDLIWNGTRVPGTGVTEDEYREALETQENRGAIPLEPGTKLTPEMKAKVAAVLTHKFGVGVVPDGVDAFLKCGRITAGGNTWQVLIHPEHGPFLQLMPAGSGAGSVSAEGNLMFDTNGKRIWGKPYIF